VVALGTIPACRGAAQKRRIGVSIFSHDIYDNIRTRTIVLRQGRILLIPADGPAEGDGTVWRLPGGGLEPHESLADCARREVLEEIGIPVRVGRIALLREWVVPRYTQPADPGDGYGFGLEVFHYAYPEEPVPAARQEKPDAPLARWVPLAEVTALPLWPKELKPLCRRLLEGRAPEGCVAVVGQLESPLAAGERDPFV
jgi:8-oxo-dGTP pyrophosphatase MutT (NUDIX family)